MAPGVYPARLAISLTLAPSKPYSSNTSLAAAKMCPFLASLTIAKRSLRAFSAAGAFLLLESSKLVVCFILVILPKFEQLTIN